MDREAFLKGLSLPERDVELSAGIVTVRGLSRSEVVSLQDLRQDLGRLERRILELGFVDPVLSAEDVALWYESAPAGDVDIATTAISELSGTAPMSPKRDVSEVSGRRP